MTEHSHEHRPTRVTVQLIRLEYAIPPRTEKLLRLNLEDFIVLGSICAECRCEIRRTIKDIKWELVEFDPGSGA